MYAVTGITGQVGSVVASTLLAAGQSVRAVVRDRAKAAAWATLGCEVAVADYFDETALTAAFAGAHGVFAMLPPIFDPAPGFPEAEQFIGALRGALACAQPAKTVALSTIGADARQPSLLQVLSRMEHELATLPLSLTFLRAAWFMENAAWDVAAARQGVIQSFLQSTDRAVAMISVHDVGRVAAELVQENGETPRVVQLEASQRVSPDRLAAAFAKALGHPVRAETVARDRWESLFRQQGMKNPGPRMQMLDGFNEGWIDFHAADSRTRQGNRGIDEAIAALVQPAGR